MERKKRYGDVLVNIEYSKAFNDLEEVEINVKNENLIMVVDIETDGLIEKMGANVVYPQIIQVAWIIMEKGGTIYRKESSLIKDDRINFKKAVHINRINETSVNRIGNSKYEVLKKLASASKLVGNICCHNANFDIPILSHHFQLEGLGSLIKNQNVICTMKLGVNYCGIKDGGSYKFPKLTELYNKLFNTTLNQLHNAEADVLATAICLRKMIELNLVSQTYFSND